VQAAPKPGLDPGPVPVILVDAGTSGPATLHLDARGSGGVDVAVSMKEPRTQIAVARIELAFDIDASNAIAPDGTKTIRAVLRASDESVDVTP
jgi:hypothetical protein